MEGIDLAVEEGAAASRADALRRAVDFYLDHLRREEGRRHERHYFEALRLNPRLADEPEVDWIGIGPKRLLQ